MQQFLRSTSIQGPGVSNVDPEALNPQGPLTSFSQGADGSVDNFKRRRATELKHGRIAPWPDSQAQLFRACTVSEGLSASQVQVVGFSVGGSQRYLYDHGCPASECVAMQLSPSLYKSISLHGFCCLCSVTAFACRSFSQILSQGVVV